MEGSTANSLTGVSEATLFWKIADANDVAEAGNAVPGGVTISHNGNTTTDRATARVHRFTAADGFAAVPYEDVSVSAGSGTGDIAMNDVTPGGTNRRGVTIVLHEPE